MLRGVVRVDQGFICSDPPSDNWAEGIIVHFDPSVIDLTSLVDVHLRTHDATRPHVAKSKYRSAIYVRDPMQRHEAINSIAAIQKNFSDLIETRVLIIRQFKASDDRFKNYYAANPERPFCRRYINPKLDYVRQNFSGIVSPGRGGRGG